VQLELCLEEVQQDRARRLDDALVVGEVQAGDWPGGASLFDAYLWGEFVVPCAKALQNSVDSVYAEPFRVWVRIDTVDVSD
jgi:hypothetical protein